MKIGVRIAARRARLDRIYPRLTESDATGRQVGVDLDGHTVTVVEPGTPQLLGIERKAERPDEMELCTTVGAKAHGIAGVRGDFGLVEYDVKHGGS